MAIENQVPDQVYSQEDFKAISASSPTFFQYILDYFSKGSGNTVDFEKNLNANGITALNLSIEVLTHFLGQSTPVLLSRSEIYIESQSKPGKEISADTFFGRNSQAIQDLCKLIESTPVETWNELVTSHKLSLEDPEWSDIGGYFKSSALEIMNNVQSNDAMNAAKTLQALISKYFKIIKN